MTICEKNVSFDLTEEDTSTLVKPMFFHRASVASACDSAESIATLPPEPDLNDEQLRDMLLHHCTYRRERQVRTDHEFITPSEKTQCQVHLTSEQVHGDLPQCSHTNESRVKKHVPTEKAFGTSSSSRRK